MFGFFLGSPKTFELFSRVIQNFRPYFRVTKHFRNFFCGHQKFLIIFFLDTKKFLTFFTKNFFEKARTIAKYWDKFSKIETNGPLLRTAGQMTTYAAEIGGGGRVSSIRKCRLFRVCFALNFGKNGDPIDMKRKYFRATRKI